MWVFNGTSFRNNLDIDILFFRFNLEIIKNFNNITIQIPGFGHIHNKIGIILQVCSTPSR